MFARTPHAVSSKSGTVRIPSLDGLRAVSITMVILGHGLHAMPQNWPARWPLLFGVIANGGLGVSVFFVISGFLITSLLLKEEGQNGSISLRSFYVRRFFRIVPPFYAYLSCLLLLSVLGWISVGRGSFLAALCFVKDYNYLTTDWWTVHSWSLSIEEQFYLLWPAALALLKRNTATKVAVWIVAAGPITHVVSHIFFHQIGPREIFMFQIRADALMIGSLLALYEGTLLLDKVKAISGSLLSALASSRSAIPISQAIFEAGIRSRSAIPSRTQRSPWCFSTWSIIHFRGPAKC